MSIVIKKYDSVFVGGFAKEKKRLENLIVGSDYSIHHVGSTAVSGLDGKNIIDILISVKSIQELVYIKTILTDNGYFEGSQSNNEGYIFLASRKEETKEGDIHIHLALKGTRLHDDFLILRDYLKSNNDETLLYSAAKHIFAKRANNNRQKYKQYKSEYVDKLINRARAWYED